MKNAIINNKKVPWVEVEVMNQKKNTPTIQPKKKKAAINNNKMLYELQWKEGRNFW